MPFLRRNCNIEFEWRSSNVVLLDCQVLSVGASNIDDEPYESFSDWPAWLHSKCPVRKLRLPLNETVSRGAVRRGFTRRWLNASLWRNFQTFDTKGVRLVTDRFRAVFRWSHVHRPLCVQNVGKRYRKLPERARNFVAQEESGIMRGNTENDERVWHWKGN